MDSFSVFQRQIATPVRSEQDRFGAAGPTKFPPFCVPIYPLGYSAGVKFVEVDTMAHRHVVTGQQAEPQPLYRCACCEGIIENLSSDTMPSGPDPRFGFISDECLLICNACTAQLVQANRAQPAVRRK
jgi:hypothetical protein